MATSVLLVNFTKSQAEKIQAALPIDVQRGYISDGIERTNKQGGTDRVPAFDIPPIYESKVTFVNLSKVKGLEDEYKAKTFDLREIINVSKYWNERRGILVFFLGDYVYDDMKYLGVDWVNLTPANKRDNKVELVEAKKDAHLTKVFKDLLPVIKYPISHYLEMSGRWVQDHYGEPEMKLVYTNLNGDYLGAYVDFADRFDGDDLQPGVILLPSFTDNVSAVIKVLKGLAKDDEELIPEIAEQDWANSDRLYPHGVTEIDSSIQRVIEIARNDINKLQDEKDKLKESYSFMPTLLTAQHNELKEAVIEALKYLGLNVSDVDKENQRGFAEDILIETDALKVLAEVKGTRAKTPQDLYIGQVWKHIAQSELEGVKTGALILNHDLNTEPSARPDAYTGKKEKELNDIIYIDTRELHKLLLLVIDGGMDKVTAASSLLHTGRFKAGVTKDQQNDKPA